MKGVREWARKNQQLLMTIGGVAMAIVLAVLFCRFLVCNGFEFAAEDGDQMRGVYGGGSVPVSYDTRTAINFAEAGMMEEDLAARGADRAAGYGSSYHIVGQQAYPCNNDPNSLNTYACGVDDYSIWQDGTKKDFTENPIYGSGEDKGCHMRTHLASTNPYDYDPAPASVLCSANRNPRKTFDINDPFVHVAYKDSNRELSLINQHKRRAVNNQKAALMVEESA